MSIVFSQHANRLQFDVASLPASMQAFTIVLFAKVTTLPAPGFFGQLFFIQGSTSGNYIYVGSDGGVRAGAEWGANETAVLGTLTPSGTPGAGWAAISLRGQGTGAGGMRAAMRPQGGSMTTIALPFNTTATDVVDMWLGSKLNDGEYNISSFRGHYAHMKLWDAVLSDDQVLAEMLSGPPVRSQNLRHYRAMTTTPIASALAPSVGSGVLAIAAGGVNPATSTDDPVFGGPPPAIAIDSNNVSGQTVTASGTIQATAGTPSVTVQLVASGSGSTQAPVVATISGTSWSVSISPVPAGVYTTTAIVSNPGGVATAAAGSTLEVVGLSGTGFLPDRYLAGSITMTPSSAALLVNNTQTLTIVDQNGFPIDGVTVTSSATGVATVTSPSDAQGRVTVTGRSVGSATITASFSDPVAGALTAATSIAVSVPPQQTAPVFVDYSIGYTVASGSALADFVFSYTTLSSVFANYDMSYSVSSLSVEALYSISYQVGDSFSVTPPVAPPPTPASAQSSGLIKEPTPLQTSYLPLEDLAMRAIRRFGDMAVSTIDGDDLLMIVEMANEILGDVNQSPYFSGPAPIKNYEHPEDMRPVSNEIMIAGLLWKYAESKGSKAAERFEARYYRVLNQTMYLGMFGLGNAPHQLMPVKR